jgi:hypothetical protein
MTRLVRTLLIVAVAVLVGSLRKASAGEPAWTSAVIADVGEKLGGIATGDLDPSVPGDEIALASESGRVRVIRRVGADWRLEEAVHLGGEAIQVAVGDADSSRPGIEIVAFGMERGGESEDGAGVATLVYRTATGWASEVVARRGALVHGGCVADVDPDRAGSEIVLVGYDKRAVVVARGTKDWETVAEVPLASEGKVAIPFGAGALVACVGGTVEAVARETGRWRSRVLATLPAGAARLAADGTRVVVACDDGALRLIEGASVTVLHQDKAKERARGAVLADLDSTKPGLEAATAGYSGTVTVLRPGADGSSVTALEGAGRLHHLATFPLEGPSGRLGLLACGYAGKVYLLTPAD